MSRSRTLLFTIAVATFAVVGLIGVNGRRETNVVSPIVVEFRGLENIDGGSDVLAVMRVTNRSTRSFMYRIGNEIASSGANVAFSRYREKVPTGWREWNESVSSSYNTVFFLKPGATARVAARVSKTNAVCQIGAHFSEEIPRWPEPLQQVRRLWWKWVPPKSIGVTAWCEAGNLTNSSPR